jgi:hypothetical protein
MSSDPDWKDIRPTPQLVSILDRQTPGLKLLRETREKYRQSVMEALKSDGLEFDERSEAWIEQKRET